MKKTNLKFKILREKNDIGGLQQLKGSTVSFVYYGFFNRATWKLMHDQTIATIWTQFEMTKIMIKHNI